MSLNYIAIYQNSLGSEKITGRCLKFLSGTHVIREALSTGPSREKLLFTREIEPVYPLSNA